MARRQFDTQGYPCDPHDVTDHAWFYVQKEGLTVCQDGCPNCGEQRLSLPIPWKMVKHAVADHEKAKSRAVSNGDGGGEA